MLGVETIVHKEGISITHLGFDEASEEINRIAKEKKKQPAVKEEKITELKVVGV